MLINAILCYATAVILTLGCIILTLVALNKKNVRFSALHAVIGGVSSVATLVLMVLLMLYAFSSDLTDYMSALMPEWVYKISVTVLFFFSVCTIRYFVVNSAYFSKYKDDNGISFLAGFGLAPAVIVSLYCIVMLALVSFNALLYGFTGITDQCGMTFGNGSIISVFTPIYLHISVITALISYAMLLLVTAWFMRKHSKYPFRGIATICMFMLLSAFETAMVCIILFAAKMNFTIISVIFVIMAILSALTVKNFYVYKEEGKYIKQFEV